MLKKLKTSKYALKNVKYVKKNSVCTDIFYLNIFIYITIHVKYHIFKMYKILLYYLLIQ